MNRDGYFAMIYQGAPWGRMWSFGRLWRWDSPSEPAADERVVLCEGPLAPAVIASMMVPAVFPPCWVGGRQLSDPGVIDSVPVDVPAQLGAEVVAGVSADLGPADRGGWRPSRPPF